MPQSHPLEQVDATAPPAVALLLKTLRTHLASLVDAGCRDACRCEALVTATELIDGLGVPEAVAAVAPPVGTGHLVTAVERAPAATRPVAVSLARACGGLQWVRAYPNEPSSPQLDAFREGYSYTLLAAPEQPGGSAPADAPYRSDELLLGFTLQAPGVIYPLHSHSSVELYGVISGTARWYHPHDGWTLRPPGSVMFHGSYQPHGMRTGDEPLLTWVVWITDPKAPAHLL